MSRTYAEDPKPETSALSQVRLVLTFKRGGVSQTRIAEKITLDGCGGLIVGHGDKDERLLFDEISEMRIHPVRTIPVPELPCRLLLTGAGR